MKNLNIIIIFLFSIIDAVIFLNLLSIFRKDKNNSKIAKNILLIGGISAMMFFLTQIGITTYVKVILIFVILFLITFLFKIEFYERLLLVTLYYFIIIVSELLVTLLISNILKINFEAISSSYNYSFLSLGTISKLFTIVIVSLVRRKFSGKKIILPKDLNYILISILSLSSISMILLFYVSLSLGSQSIQLVLFLLCIFILFISIGVLTIYFSANDFYINLQKETTKSICNKSYEKFILNSKKREDSLSKIWHDMNNHIKVLKQMSDLENTSQIKYLNSLKDKIKGIPNKTSSGNDLINIILNDKYAETTSYDIKFDIKAVAPPKLNIDDLDLSSILFNTIDNSIEACLNSNLENKYIYLELYPENNFLYYKITNSYSSVNRNSTKKIYLNKKDYISEGYGLRIIEDIVEKYSGYIYIHRDENEYSVTIILHLNNSELVELEI